MLVHISLAHQPSQHCPDRNAVSPQCSSPAAVAAAAAAAAAAASVGRAVAQLSSAGPLHRSLLTHEYSISAGFDSCGLPWGTLMMNCYCSESWLSAVQGTLNLIAAAKQAKVKKFVLVTSIGTDDPLFPLNLFFGVRPTKPSHCSDCMIVSVLAQHNCHPVPTVVLM